MPNCILPVPPIEMRGKRLVQFLIASLLSPRNHYMAFTFLTPTAIPRLKRPCLFPIGLRYLSAAKPKRGHVVDSYQTVTVSCNKCRLKLFRYKKKNGTKSNLIKMYVERIADDTASVLRDQYGNKGTATEPCDLTCPNCQTRFARSTTIKGLPALKLVGGKVLMTKK